MTAEVMGIEIEQERFTETDRRRFKQRLLDDLAALEGLIGRPGFGAGERTIGAELELFLIDGEGRPFPVNEQVQSAAGSPLITPELGAFSIELNTPPVRCAGRPFSALREHMGRVIGEIEHAAAVRGARVVPVGILPTFRPEDFSPRSITDRPRYRALAAGLRRLRRGPYTVHIDGDDPLVLSSEDIALEGANLAFQLHVRVAPEEFARMFNAALLLTAPVLAAAGNSPTFLGHRLWHETRVALFQQAGDDRPAEIGSDWQPPGRTGFGSGWVREGAVELFRESVALYEPILPICSQERPLVSVEQGGVPELSELRLHHGTVWSWNRPVYDPVGKNLRIELRALPAGPTLDDMLANAAFLLGAMFALAPRMRQLSAALPFALARQNFFLAARHGLEAELWWPSETGGAPVQRSAREILLSLLDEAERALLEAGVDPTECCRYLSVFAARVESGQTGAVWQSKLLHALQQAGRSLDAALAELLERYIEASGSERPVHLWPLSVAPKQDEEQDAAEVRDSELFEVAAVSSALAALDEASAGASREEAGRV